MTDDRLIEAANHFEGHTFGVGDGSLRRARHWPYLWNPFRPSWGEPYEVIARRMLAVMADAREAARGHEVVCVSHQLPIWVTRRKIEGRRLWHNPARRECAPGQRHQRHLRRRPRRQGRLRRARGRAVAPPQCAGRLTPRAQ